MHGESTPSARPTDRRLVMAASTLLGGLLMLGSGGPTNVSAAPSGVVESWGSNYYGQLGGPIPQAQNNNPYPVPLPLSGQSGASAVAGGGGHSLALKADRVWAWGRNNEGELGVGSFGASKLSAVEVETGLGSFLTGVTAMTAGGFHSLALRSDGTVWAWGSNSNGQLGDGTTSSTGYAVQVHTDVANTLQGVIAIAAGNYHSVALKSDGTVWAWGLNSAHQLGNGTTTDSVYPVQVQTGTTPTYLTGVTDIAAAIDHSVAVTSTGGVWGWGENGAGELGDGTQVERSTAVQTQTASGPLATGTTTHLAWPLRRLAAGTHTLVLKSDGSVWGWGSDYWGQLGDGTRGDTGGASCFCRTRAVRATGPLGTALAGVKSVSAGFDHSLALMTNGTARGWGSDGSGELGDGTLGNPIPVIPADPTNFWPLSGCFCWTTAVVLQLAGVTDLAAGAGHSLAVIH